MFPCPNLRVGMAASLASVDDVEVLEREPELSSQRFNLATKFSLWERVKLVEKRLDWRQWCPETDSLKVG